jgi:tryptophan-rich sensory protein
MDTVNTTLQYQNYIKPDWAPPAYLFGVAWSFLYVIIIISFGYVLWKWYQGKVSGKIALPFLINLVSNLIYNPIQFGLQNNVLACIDILIVLATLIWFMIAIWKKYKWVALVNIPYLLWVSFATVLQLTITYLNW